VHDDIGGSLTAVRFDLAWIERHGGNHELLAHVASANSMLQHALGASQRIMMNLRPAILDQGLVAALQWLTDGFASRTGIRASLDVRQIKTEVPKPLQLVVYRTAQEALTNVSKHAQCTSVSIEISDANDVLTLEISDDGKGISPTDLLAQDAFGIKGLHERARTVGGWIDVVRQNEAGTSIILTVPLSAVPTQ
jgi:signal transduction histidine kinase